MTDDLQNNKRYLETMTPATGRMIRENFTIANIADCFDLDDEGNLALRIAGLSGGDSLWELVGNYIKPLLDRKAVMTGGGVIPKSNTATAIVPQYPSKDLEFIASYWNGTSEEERKIRLKMYEDSGVEWLSFIDQDDNEFLTLRKGISNKAYDLISRQSGLEASPVIGCVEDVGSNNIVEYRNQMGVNGGTVVGGFDGLGNVNYANNVLSRKLFEDVEVESANRLENSNMSEWWEIANGWDFSKYGDETAPIKTEDSATGNFALQFQSDGVNESEIKRIITVVAETEYDPSVDVKDGTVDFGVYYMDGEDSYYYQFAGANIGTWQIANNPEGDSRFECVGGSGSYSTITPTSFTIPVGITEIYLHLRSYDTAKIDNVKLIGEDTNDVVENGGFETWRWFFPKNYFFSSFTETSNATIEREETEYHSEPYSVKMIAGANPSDYSFFVQGANTDYRGKFSFWLKAGTATTARGILLGLGQDDDNYKIFFFTGANALTWQTWDGNITSGNIKTFNITNSWTEYEVKNIPSNEVSNMTFGLLSPEVEGQYYYIDDFEMFNYPRTAVDFHTLEIKNAITEFKPTDTVLKIKTRDGFIPFQIKDGCVFDTDENQFDLEQADVPTLVKHSYTELTGAVNKFSAESLLGLVLNVDLKDENTVYDFNFQLPAGSYIINPRVVILITNANTLSGNARFEIKNNESQLIGAQEIQITNALQQKSFDASSGIGTLLNSGENATINLQITSADSGTSGDANFYLFGTIYDETYNGNGEQL